MEAAFAARQAAALARHAETHAPPAPESLKAGLCTSCSLPIQWPMPARVQILQVTP
jgi:hypothetical protein